VNALRLDPTADRPISLQLADVLRSEILDGTRRPGSQLPTESEFQNDYGVSRTTVRTALRELIGQGLVVSRKGYGSYVRDQRPIRRVAAGRRAGSHKPVFDEEIESQGHVPSRRMLQVGRVAVPDEIADLLALPHGSEAVIRQRLHLVDDEPTSISTSYYPLWLAGDTALEGDKPIPEGPDALIEDLGHVFGKCTEVFRARMPLAEEARLLRLDPGVPVIRVVRTDYDRTGRPLQVADDLYSGDRHEITVTFDDEAGAETP
jgi:GntR family transcriptional regulator